MKLNIFKLAAGILSLCIFTACEKETSLENGPSQPGNPGNPSADSSYIDRIRFVEIERNGLDSFTYVDKYGYDANKRLTSIVSDSMYANPGNLSSHTYSYKINFYYNGTDTLPFKKVAVTDDSQYQFGGKDTTTTWFFYTGNKLLKDSTITIHYPNPPGSYSTGTEIRRFSYAPGKIFVKTIFTNYDRYDTLQLDANENIINSKTYDDTGDFLFETLVTYDGKPNPLSRYKPFYNYIITGPEPNEGIMNGFNNYSSLKNFDILNGNQLVDESYTYQYNALGFPTMQSQNGFGPVDKLVFQYYYKSL
jgi:hypothetical protein